jgi:hypothetical protein
VDREAERLPAAVAIGAAGYRGLLRLYPYTFWRVYHDELEIDFEQASLDALDTGGRLALARCWAGIASDLLGSVAREWLRTPWIPVLLVGVVVAVFGVVFTIGRAHTPLRVYRSMVAPHSPTPPDSPQLLALLTVVALIPIVGLVLVAGASALANLWPGKPRRRV